MPNAPLSGRRERMRTPAAAAGSSAVYRHSLFHNGIHLRGSSENDCSRAVSAHYSFPLLPFRSGSTARAVATEPSAVQSRPAGIAIPLAEPPNAGRELRLKVGATHERTLVPSAPGLGSVLCVRLRRRPWHGSCRTGSGNATEARHRRRSLGGRGRAPGPIGHRFQNPCDGMRNARLKREDAFSHAMIIVSSAMVSSS